MADQMDQLLGPIVAHRPSKARISLTTVVPDLGISVIFNLPRQPQVWLIHIRHLVWELLATFRDFWELLANCGKLRQLVATFGNFWQLLANFGNI